jgi:UDP:flavonoid glycosyltransferase YjiC (YdhE family)
MKFVLASFGTRGDIEPSVAVGRELQRRGHDVHMAVTPQLVGFAESAGLTTAPYGLHTEGGLDALRNFWSSFFHNFWNVTELIRLWGELWEPVAQNWEEMTTTLTALTDGADLVFSGLNFEQLAANVAEYQDIPFAALHFFPIRANGQLFRSVPSPLLRFTTTVNDWLSWRLTKKVEDAQRRRLGLPKANGPAARRLTHRRVLEIQAYDEICFPGLPAEWAKWGARRPFVGSLTMELSTDADDEVASWIAAGTPPICFSFGSFPVESAAGTIEMISAACAELGERALVCSGWSDFGDVRLPEHVKVVGAVNYAETFAACRAVVHAGSAGTTAASLRAGVPTLVLWTLPDQPIWGAQVKRLKVGTSRRFSATTQESLVRDLRQILAPEYATRAREIATYTSKPADSIANTADLLEHFARSKRID